MRRNFTSCSLTSAEASCCIQWFETSHETGKTRAKLFKRGIERPQAISVVPQGYVTTNAAVSGNPFGRLVGKSDLCLWAQRYGRFAGAIWIGTDICLVKSWDTRITNTCLWAGQEGARL